jgi:chorismate mutase
MRQGGDPRLPLELGLVKVTRPGSDLSRESLAFRLDRLEQGREGARATSTTEAPAEPTPEHERDDAPAPPAAPPTLELEQLQEAWRRTVLPAVEERSIPTAAMLAEARPAALADETLTLEFPPAASFHRSRAEEQKNADLLREALYEVTGRRLSLVFAVGEDREHTSAEVDRPATEEEIVELMKSTFDARELDP